MELLLRYNLILCQMNIQFKTNHITIIDRIGFKNYYKQTNALS